MSNLERIQKIIVDHFGLSVSIVTEQALLRNDLMLDSLDDVELELALQDEFLIGVETGSSDDWLTVGDIVAFVNRAVADRELEGGAA
jgi:acyl carrier protein